jgi:hypothetical protein
MTRRLPLLLGASLATLALTSLTGTAQAGGVHFSGGAHFSGHVGGGIHVGGGGGYHAAVHWGGGGGGGYYHPQGWSVRGRVWAGGYRPYYRPYYYYPVPAYYGASYYPVEGASVYSTPSETAPIVIEPELPKLGIGVFGGGVSTNYNIQTNTQESDIGLLGRYRLTPSLLIEGEAGKTSTSVNGIDNIRVDRRLGGSLVYEIAPYNHLAPYFLAGLGVQQANVDGNYNTTQDYGEIGLGLRYAFTRNFHVTFDLRAGSRSSVSSDSPPATAGAAASIAPPSSTSSQSEDYTRARLAAILYF